MASLFKVPKVPKVKPVPDEAAGLRERLRGRGGEASTLLSGAAGVQDRGNVFKRNLGGTQL